MPLATRSRPRLASVAVSGKTGLILPVNPTRIDRGVIPPARRSEGLPCPDTRPVERGDRYASWGGVLGLAVGLVVLAACGRGGSTVKAGRDDGVKVIGTCKVQPKT